MLGTALNTADEVVNKTGKVPALKELHSNND